MIILSVMYLFVPRTRIPKLKKNSLRKILGHVSLSFNKKRHLEVCTCYGNDNVRMKPISYRIHGNVLRMSDIRVSGFARKFQEHVNYNVGY
jgi:hypothetical protein